MITLDALLDAMIAYSIIIAVVGACMWALCGVIRGRAETGKISHERATLPETDFTRLLMAWAAEKPLGVRTFRITPRVGSFADQEGPQVLGVFVELQETGPDQSRRRQTTTFSPHLYEDKEKAAKVLLIIMRALVRA